MALCATGLSCLLGVQRGHAFECCVLLAGCECFVLRDDDNNITIITLTTVTTTIIIIITSVSYYNGHP